jgi:hypothetical protein
MDALGRSGSLRVGVVGNPTIMKSMPRWGLAFASAVALAVYAGGCGPEETKLATAPAFTTAPDTKPAQPPNRKSPYGASKKYQDSMERRYRDLGN